MLSKVMRAGTGNKNFFIWPYVADVKMSLHWSHVLMDTSIFILTSYYQKINLLLNFGSLNLLHLTVTIV